LPARGRFRFIQGCHIILNRILGYLEDKKLYEFNYSAGEWTEVQGYETLDFTRAVIHLVDYNELLVS